MTSITLPRSRAADGLAFHQTGEGIPILFIHGVGLRSESWYQQVDAFKNDFSVFTVDIPGHGESDLLHQPEPELFDYTEKMAKFIIDEVKQPAIIVGHSMGALLALSLAKEYPELCTAVVAMNTIYKRSDEAKQAVQERASKLAKLTGADACAPISRWFSETPSKQDEYHAELCREWLLSANLQGYGAAYKVFAYEDGPKTSAVSRFTMPVLYVTGELDKNSNVSMTNALANITPNAEAVIINDSRHMTPLTHADEVNHAVIKFLERRLLNTASEKLG